MSNDMDALPGKALRNGGATLNRESWKIFQIMAEFVEGFKRLNDIQPAVSIFGSARTPEDSPYFKLTEEIARKLSDSGFAVVSLHEDNAQRADAYFAAEAAARKAGHGRWGRPELAPLPAGEAAAPAEPAPMTATQRRARWASASGAWPTSQGRRAPRSTRP